jgi:tetratricopeptide (TPR) repeat protein
MTEVAIVLALTGLCAGRAFSQALPTGEAASQEEFDLYIDFHETVDPEAKHRAALSFERAYPDSKLLVDVYRSELDYARSQDDRQAAIEAGHKALRLAPNDVRVLLGLAEVLPNGTSDGATLAQAEQYARRALIELNDLHLSHEVTLSECDKVRNTLTARAHAALGYTAGKEGRLTQAIDELQTAVAMSPEPAGADLLRLGELYRAARREHEAVEMFSRAVRAGPSEISSLAERELNRNR